MGLLDSLTLEKPDSFNLTDVLDYTPSILEDSYIKFHSKQNRGIGFRKTVRTDFEDFEGMGKGQIVISDDKEKGMVTRWVPYMGDKWVEEQNNKFVKAEFIMNAPLHLAPLIAPFAARSAPHRTLIHQGNQQRQVGVTQRGGHTLRQRSQLNRYKMQFIKSMENQRIENATNITPKRGSQIVRDVYSLKRTEPSKGIIPKYSSGAVVQTEDGTLYRPTPGTMTSTFTTTTGDKFSDEEIAYSLDTTEFDQTSIDLKGKVNDRDFITTWFKRRRKNDLDRRTSYDLALSLRQPEKSRRGIKEQFAGHLYVQEVEQIAKELNLENEGEGISYRFTPLDVYRYITREETLHENIIKSVTMLNDIAFPGNMQRVDAKIKQLEEENVLKPGTHDKFLKQLIRFRETSGETTFPQKQVGVDQAGNPVTVIDWGRLSEVGRKGRFQRPWSKGHKKALARIFAEGLTGADVHTNLFLEPYWSQYITAPDETETLIKGNAANADLQDAPLYVQVLLEGQSWDLKDDFLKSVTPDNIHQTHEIEEAYLDKGESINLEYQEVAKIMYNKLLSPEGLKNWGIDIDLNKLAKGRNVELLKSYAAAQGIKAYMKAFDEAVEAGARTLSGQRLSSVDLNNWWLSGKWTGANIKLKERLDRILIREIKKSLKLKNVDLIEKPINDNKMKDIVDKSHPER